MLPAGDSSAFVKIKSISLKLSTAGADVGLQVDFQQAAGLGIEVKDLLHHVVSDEVQSGLPSGNEPVLVVFNARTHAVNYWKLTDKVKMIRLKKKASHVAKAEESDEIYQDAFDPKIKMVSTNVEESNEFEIKVMNEKPLRVELWIDVPSTDIEIVVEMKE